MSVREEMIEVVARVLEEQPRYRAKEVVAAIEEAFPPVLRTEIPEHRIAAERDEAREVLRELHAASVDAERVGGSLLRLDAARKAARRVLESEERTHALVRLGALRLAAYGLATLARLGREAGAEAGRVEALAAELESAASGDLPA